MWDAPDGSGVNGRRETCMSLGAPELLMILVMLLILAAFVAGIVVLTVFLVKRSSKRP